MSDFVFTVPAGMFCAPTKEVANAMAYDYAWSKAPKAKFCCELRNIQCCVNDVVAELFEINDGTGPFTWQITGGSMITGLSMSFLDGGRTMIVTGTPSSPGISSLTIKITDPAGNSLTETMVISVTGIIDTTPLTAAQQGVAYSHQFNATGGSGSYAFGVVSGSLPPGLTLTSGGLLSGTPTLAGNYSFEIGVTSL